jgi:hypothetical protein
MEQHQAEIYAEAEMLWRRALSGNTEETLLIIEHMDPARMHVLASDLHARLCVQAGRLAEARAIWRRIVQVHPDYIPAVSALAKLDSPWLIWAVTRKFSLWFGICILMIFGLAGAGVLLFGSSNPFIFLIALTVIVAVLGAYLAGLFFYWAFALIMLYGTNGR